MNRVLVAMSGGVDSAVSALLLKEQGWDVTGANMRFWEYKNDETSKSSFVEKQDVFSAQMRGIDARKNLGRDFSSASKNDTECRSDSSKRTMSCCSPEDLGDARRVAESIGVPFYALKMESDFRQNVINPFIKDYQSGRTPNPCVHCNTFIKFGEFYNKAGVLGFEKIATGHYASIRQLDNGRWTVSPAADVRKDQSYYLYGLSQEALAKTLFPLAGLNKSEVRDIARLHKLLVSEKPDSQEICFIPDNDYRKFLKREGIEFQPGFFRDTQNRILGKHSGKENFTIGQRKGLQISAGHPLFVMDILDDGDVILGKKKEMDQRKFIVNNLNFMGWDENISFEKPVKCRVQIRYNGRPVSAEVGRINQDSYSVLLHESAWAITPGQAAVFYDTEEGFILAGGKICRSKVDLYSPYVAAR